MLFAIMFAIATGLVIHAAIIIAYRHDKRERERDYHSTHAFRK